MTPIEHSFTAPWPTAGMIRGLASSPDLGGIVGPKQSSVRAVRENRLEELIFELVRGSFSPGSVIIRQQAGRTLGASPSQFPGRAIPDLAIHCEGRVHFLEVKSSRTDYPRFDDVCDSKPMQLFLGEMGDSGVRPFEVEQDLIKLGMLPGLSDRVGVCLFFMLDAYTGLGRSWTDVFLDPVLFRSTMRTEFIRSRAETIIASTLIERIQNGGREVRVIVSAVPAMHQR
jgi:hypothetical protein